ncbi:MAG TPA: MG2 domain-containing protein, partial [Candidatus Acidoferrum sp.]
MESPSRKTRLGRLWIYLLLIVVIFGVAAGIFVQTFQAANGGPTVATYRRGSLFVSIPYGALRAGTGRLTLEILDPEDRVLGRKETPLEIGEGAGTWKEEIRLEKALPIEDLVWHRVHYRFVYDDGKGEALEGAESISQILRTPVVHILGQQSYLSGSQAAVRVIVTDSSNEPVTGRGWVRIELADSGQTPRKLFVGRLNKRGTTEAQFQFPAGVVGNHQVRYAAETAIGSTEFIQTVRLQDKVAILLTTEKPIYQPGQMIHARALALDRANHEAVGNRQLVFEVEDSRGNKVFKKVMRTDEFGIAWAEFGLADEVNLGTYHLRALLGEAGAEGSNTAETALTVERYVLPKFKVAIDFAGKDAKPKHGYRPGDRVTGTVQANYFFGKPLEAAEVSVKATGMDVVMFEAGSAEGKTDREGTYRFDFKLPNFFAGRPLSHGAAQVVVEATVRDTAGHAETRGEPITVSESPLLITAVPEGGTFIPNLENQVFILTSYADGTPAKTGLRIRATGNAEQHATTDEGGVAVVRVTPDGGSGTLQIEAKDKEGNTGGNTITMQSRQGQEQILLRTERAVYCPGDMMNLRVFSTKKQGTAYVDIVKEGQTVLTRDLDIVGGQAELRLAATPTMAGTVDISAYLFGGDARPIADHRLVFVQPADELRIETTTDAPSYKPGGDARIRFRVTNSRGQGVRAALGLQVVDEAVFALAEKQPGFAKVFFYLEQEVMKPRYEIHAIGLPETVEPTEESKTEQRDRAARALFSATEMVNNNRFQTEFGRTIPLTKYWEYAGRYRTHFQTQMVTISESLRRACAEKTGEEDVTKVFDRLA